MNTNLDRLADLAKEISLEAPTGQPARAWTETEKEMLSSAMEVIIEKEIGQ